MNTTHWFVYHSRLPSSQLSSSQLPVLRCCYLSTATTPQLPAILLTSQLFTPLSLHVSLLLSPLLPTCMTTAHNMNTALLLPSSHLSTSWLPPHGYPHTAGITSSCHNCYLTPADIIATTSRAAIHENTTRSEPATFFVLCATLSTTLAIESVILLSLSSSLFC